MFSYKELREFFAKLSATATVLPFDAAARQGMLTSANTVIMRHDIDVDIYAAMRVAEIESEFDIRSTFFFLTGCEMYNLASPAGRQALRSLVENGFEVGLHFDPLLYPEASGQGLSTAVEREAAWIADISGQAVRSISLHNPSVHKQFPRFDGFINAYDPAFFDPDFYMSDSCMGFRGKDPFKFVELVRERSLQILLHPFHYSEDGGGYPGLYRAYIDRLARRIDDAMQVNSTFVQQMGGRPLIEVAR